ncbi:phytoene/squalene synthase family protein [Paraflavisolibacter sp. H34]|uniref:phytoene/squalene synthase family protein n=1 Tax=Huijunlia imazamoxiresistens TaxID=3127457 RepID=UPI0030185590
MTVDLYDKASSHCSQAVTKLYSTSFASAIRLLHADLQGPIYNIYGFVRLADEIVDTFHGHDQEGLLQQFREQTFDALERGISLNPILNSFQQTVRAYGIDHGLIRAFFASMASDLTRQAYDRQGYEEYIYGSAEVVGLMCLYVFCEGDAALYQRLRAPAQALGAAFQKVNFLRDIKSDFHDLSRMYFPGCDFHRFTHQDKQRIEAEIEADFRRAKGGILQLPLKARFGVYVAFKYYYCLFNKIKGTRPHLILHQRIRVPDYHKAYILFKASIRNTLRMI